MARPSNHVTQAKWARAIEYLDNPGTIPDGKLRPERVLSTDPHAVKQREYYHANKAAGKKRTRNPKKRRNVLFRYAGFDPSERLS